MTTPTGNRTAPPKAAFLLSHEHWTDLYGPPVTAAIGGRTTLLFDPADRPQLADVSPGHAEAELLFTGWGTRPLTPAVLDQMPFLRMIFSGSGSTRSFVTYEVWARGIRITSSHAANAIPVSQYVVSMVLLSLKRVFHYAQQMRATRQWPQWPVRPKPVGAYAATVGLISLGTIGRLVAQSLRSHELRVIAYDPYVRPREAAELGVELVTLEEIFGASDVVSLHTPLLAATQDMLGAEHFAGMKRGATFINTARGQLVREPELIEVMRARSDLQAVLDVTWPEPPARRSPLYELPNITLTPHLAGSLGNECQRHGWYMVDELDRYLANRPLAWEITRERASFMA